MQAAVGHVHVYDHFRWDRGYTLEAVLQFLLQSIPGTGKY